MDGYEHQTGRGRAAKRRVAATNTATPDKKRRGVSRGVPKQPAAPPSIDLNTTHPSLNNFTANRLVLYLTSDKPEAVTWALNGLLQATSDFNTNYCLGPCGEKILLALVKLFDETIGWKDYSAGKTNNDAEWIGNLSPTVASWDVSSLSSEYQKWEQLCRERLASPLASSSDPSHLIDVDTDCRILDVIVAILRNLSFVAQNLRLMAYTPQVMRVLIGALYYKNGGRSGDDRSGEDGSSVSSSTANNMCVSAIQTLINLAPIIDITGRQFFIDRAFLDSDSKEIVCTIPDQQEDTDETNHDASIRLPSYGMASYLGFGGMALAKQYDGKAETLSDANIPDLVVLEVSGSLVEAYRALFPALAAIMNPNDSSSKSTFSSGWHRLSVQAALELFIALMENPDNNGIFRYIPPSMFRHLTELLFIPRLGPDAIDYIDPISNTVVRVMALKFMRYDATIDTDVRDRACEALAAFTELSDHNKVALGMSQYKSDMENEQDGASLVGTTSSRRINVRLYDSLMSMITSSSNRGDGGGVAMRVLTNLAAVPQNRTGILYVERKLLSLAGKDPHIARVACSGILNKLS